MTTTLLSEVGCSAFENHRSAVISHSGVPVRIPGSEVSQVDEANRKIAVADIHRRRSSTGGRFHRLQDGGQHRAPRCLPAGMSPEVGRILEDVVMIGAPITAIEIVMSTTSCKIEHATEG